MLEFIMVVVIFTGFGSLIWSKEGLLNTSVKLFLFVLALWGGYLTVNYNPTTCDIPEYDKILSEQ